jgi:riboflavin synthase
MFTGIVETTGLVKEIIAQGGNKTFWIESVISKELNIDQSISHNGICLTVEAVRENIHRITAIAETLKKTNMDDWKTGDPVNLERCLKLDSRLDGHLVLGHIDTTATCVEKKEKKGSREYEFVFSKTFSGLVIEKGSICLNGISLTTFDVKKKNFKVAIIPYTLEHTNMRSVGKGDRVNIEFDLIGKYVLRRLSLKE